MSITFRAVVGAACATSLLALGAAPASAATPAQQIDAAMRTAMTTQGLHAALVQVQVGRRIVIRRAYGQSLPGVPASVRMHFRNGNVAAAYMSTLLLRLVDRGVVKLSDPLSKYRPALRDKPGPGDGDRVTLGMLAGMTAGYHDYEKNARLGDFIYGRPFERMTTGEQLGIAFSRPIQFTPGTNWSYAHTDYVLLGLALERATGLPLQDAIAREVLRPLGLRNTRASITGAIPEPVLHTYTSERRDFLQIPRGQPFLEESTFWNPSWTFARGAVQTTNLDDMTRSIIAVGTGRLLSRASHRLQISANRGFGRPQEGCEVCRTLDRKLGYGLGVFRRGAWLGAEPLFAGLGSVAAYLPSDRIAISVVTALGARGFTEDGSSINTSRTLFNEIARIMAPDHPPS